MGIIGGIFAILYFLRLLSPINNYRNTLTGEFWGIKIIIFFRGIFKKYILFFWFFFPLPCPIIPLQIYIILLLSNLFLLQVNSCYRVIYNIYIYYAIGPPPHIYIYILCNYNIYNILSGSPHMFTYVYIYIILSGHPHIHTYIYIF